jgi:uncharacterized protein
MQIRVDDIKEGGLSLVFEEEISEFPALVEIDDDRAMFAAPLQVSLRAVRIHGLVQFEGKIETRVKLSCSRCLKEFETPLAVPFSLTYSRELPAPSEESEEEGVEITAEEMGLIPFQGDQIDLREAIQEQVVMGLPLRPLCQENCRGLCPQCGAELAAGQCGCERTDAFNRFAALKNFKVEKKAGD